MLLANMGVTSYQERVPLQLMDFAYRYTSAILTDALHLTSENYGGSGAQNKNNDANAVSLQAVRLAINSRSNYQFSSGLPKEYFQELAQEKNRVAFPPVSKEAGLALPPERYCLTGVGYGLKEEWESSGEEEVPEAMDLTADNEGEENEDEDKEEGAADIFGDDFGAAGEDEDMDDV